MGTPPGYGQLGDPNWGSAFGAPALQASTWEQDFGALNAELHGSGEARRRSTELQHGYLPER